MARRRSSLVDDVIRIGASMPWWVTAVLAIATYLLLHRYAQSEVAEVTSHKDAGSIMVQQVFKTVALYGQYVFPGLLAIGAIGSLFKAKKRSSLFNFVSRGQVRDKLDEITWQQFEELVHELFARDGYQVTETAKGADGGIDLRLRKDGQSATVQCKHWRRKKVGVNVVREQFGIMAAEGADKGFVVSSGEFTLDAYAFSKGKNLTLIDGDELSGLLASMSLGLAAVPQVAHTATQICPRCSSDMVVRVARRGKHAGSEFWGCTRYPKCRGTLNL